MRLDLSHVEFPGQDKIKVGDRMDFIVDDEHRTYYVIEVTTSVITELPTSVILELLAS